MEIGAKTSFHGRGCEVPLQVAEVVLLQILRHCELTLCGCGPLWEISHHQGHQGSFGRLDL